MLLLASPEIGSSSYTLFLLEEFLWGPLTESLHMHQSMPFAVLSNCSTILLMWRRNFHLNIAMVKCPPSNSRYTLD